MKTKKIEDYSLYMDDHCLVVETNQKDPKWLSRRLCEWISDNYPKIDFDNDVIVKDDDVSSILIVE